jgi:hypothetical protein
MMQDPSDNTKRGQDCLSVAEKPPHGIRCSGEAVTPSLPGWRRRLVRRYIVCSFETLSS